MTGTGGRKMLLYEYMAEKDTKAHLNRALNESEQARLARLCQESNRSSALAKSLRESFLAFLEWQGTLRVRLGPALDY
jgi:hypothetical protein